MCGLFFNNIALMEIGSFAIVGYCFYDLICQKKDLMPIGLIALCISGIQWLVSPIFSYKTSSIFYGMTVNEDVYLRLTLIGYTAFFIGIYFGKKHSKVQLSVAQASRFCKRHLNVAYLLIVLGGISILLPTPNSIMAFLKELTNMLFIIGCIIYMYARPDNAVKAIVPAIGLLFISSLTSGMFHNLMVWSLFLILTLFLIRGYGSIKKILITVGLFFCVVTLQTVKSAYRAYVWSGNVTLSANKASLFVDLFCSALIGDFDNDNNASVNDRFNQGWIIARIYSRFPQDVDYLYGKTIFEGIEASLLPRFLAPGKKDSGSASIKDFEYFTGHKLSSSTSMGLSIWGEAYGNFGLYVGALFMCLWGWLITQLLRLIQWLNKKYGFWFFFTPLICFNLIKAEINFISVMNWTLKSLIYVWLIVFLMRILYPQNELGAFLQKKTRGR